MNMGSEILKYNWRVGRLIEVTRLNNIKITLNADLIEMVEENPDTLITLTNGRKYLVKESRQEIKERVVLYKKEVFCNI